MNKALLLSLVLSADALLAQSGGTLPSAAGPATTNAKPDIKLIFASETVFTNAAGLVMQKISPTLWVSRTEVTQAAFKKVTGANPSAFPGDDKPVENVSWNGAIAFCRSLTAYESKEAMLPEGYAYWLPTQAQWESLAAGDNLDKAVTSAKTPRRATEAVGSLGVNAAGLSDLRGNVMEWTADLNPSYDYRIARGAAWNTSFEVNLRPEFRVYKGPNEAANDIGFRVILIPDGEAK